MYTYQELLAAVVAHPGVASVDVLDPATDEFIGHAPMQSVEELEAAIDLAVSAQLTWAELTDAERRQYLHRAADAIEQSAEALAELLSREQGKPLNGINARVEVADTAAWLRADADAELPFEVVIDDGETYAEMHYRPLGVIGAITPWNWPLSIAGWQIGPSLRMGNTVVQKPAETTTLSGLALVHVMNDVLPKGVLVAVAGTGDTVGAALSRSPKIAKIMFTGSTAVGKKIIEASATGIKRLTLELGGNDAGIVLPDVDPAAIAEDLFWGAYINTGQTCAALKRLYVHEDVYDEVVSQLVAYARTVPMGVGMDEQNMLGPLQNRKQFDVVDRLVEAAKVSGATVELGGDPDRGAPGNFYPTTIVSGIDPRNPLVLEEQFGPALPVVKFSDVEEAIRLANELEVGLGASVWSGDRSKAISIASRLEAGTVWINSHGAVHPKIPFGGVKQSGYGREFGVEGLKAVSEPQVING